MGCGVSKFDLRELGPRPCEFEPKFLEARVDEIRVGDIKIEQVNEPTILVSSLSFKHFIRENDKSLSTADQSHDHNVSSPVEDQEACRDDLDKFVKVVDKSEDEEVEFIERKESLFEAPVSPSFREYCLIGGHASIHDEEESWVTNVATPRERGINSNIITSRKSDRKKWEEAMKYLGDEWF